MSSYRSASAISRRGRGTRTLPDKPSDTRGRLLLSCPLLSSTDSAVLRIAVCRAPCVSEQRWKVRGYVRSCFSSLRGDGGGGGGGVNTAGYRGPRRARARLALDKPALKNEPLSPAIVDLQRRDGRDAAEPFLLIPRYVVCGEEEIAAQTQKKAPSCPLLPSRPLITTSLFRHPLTPRSTSSSLVTSTKPNRAIYILYAFDKHEGQRHPRCTALHCDGPGGSGASLRRARAQGL